MHLETDYCLDSEPTMGTISQVNTWRNKMTEVTIVLSCTCVNGNGMCDSCFIVMNL